MGADFLFRQSDGFDQIGEMLVFQCGDVDPLPDLFNHRLILFSHRNRIFGQVSLILATRSLVYWF